MDDPQKGNNLKAVSWMVAVLAVAPACLLKAQTDVRGGFSVLDISEVDPGRIEWGYQSTTIEQLSDEAREIPLEVLTDNARAEDPQVSLVDTLSIKPYLLLPSAPAGTRGPVIGAVPPEIRHVSLTIAGERFVLDVIESEADPVFAFRHVSAAAVSDPPDGYARFTVDDVGGLIVGTIRTERHTYRLVPSATSGVQLVYSIASNRAGIDEVLPRLYRPIRTEQTSSGARQIEMRHLQAEMVGEIQPAVYTDDGLLVRLRAKKGAGEGLGHVDLKNVTDPRQIRRLLAELGPLTGANGDESFEITSVEGSDEQSEGTYRILYRQVVDGISVGVPREIVVSSDGSVLSLEAALLDAEDLPDTSNRMSSAEALQAAVRALEAKYGAAGGFEYDHLSDKATLAFRVVNGEWAPVWRSLFSISTNSRSEEGYWVSVNIVTGETVIASSDFD